VCDFATTLFNPHPAQGGIKRDVTCMGSDGLECPVSDGLRKDVGSWAEMDIDL
jgi:hypothetical protein